MKKAHKALLDGLLIQLHEEERAICQTLSDHLAALGYVPRRQRTSDYTLSFQHGVSTRPIAKLRVRSQSPGKLHVEMRFFACKRFPAKFSAALSREIESRKGQYCATICSSGPGEEGKRVDNMYFCGFCPSCTGGGYGYYFRAEDGGEMRRCGAYTVPIPCFGPDDVNDALSMLTEQHAYFLRLDAPSE